MNMKAMTYYKYGSPDNLKFEEIARPEIREYDILVKVCASSLNWHDWHFLTGTPFLARLMAGLSRPKHSILGIDLAGRIEAVGAHVSDFSPGDEVFGTKSNGCFAEYVRVSRDEIVPKPASLSFEAAAAVPAAAVSVLHGLRDQGHVQPGYKVLINGASGGLGTFAVQIAKAFAAEVTGVCSTRNLEMVRAIGADAVIDYTQEDFTLQKQRYDVIFDTVAKRSYSECQRVLTPQGIYITTAFSPAIALRGMWISLRQSKKMAPLPPKPPSKVDLIFLQELLEKGQITPVIDRVYTLSEIPEAFHYLVKGHARGKIVIKVN